MFINDVLVKDYYKKQTSYGDFLGYLPVLKEDVYSYYTVPNLLTESEHKRVSVVFGYDKSSRRSLIEMKYEIPLSKEDFKAKKIRGSYQDYLAKRDEIMDNISMNPYLAVFIGCDDGDICMRFRDKSDAINYLSQQIVYFDDVYNDPRMMTYN